MNKNIFLKLKLSEKCSHYGLYEYSKSARSLDYLRIFLTDDVLCNDINKWKQFISNLKDDEHTGGNISFLERRKNKIIIGDSLAKDRYAITYEITIKNLLEVLNQWEQLCKEKPKEIWIFEENGKVWLEGKN